MVKAARYAIWVVFAHALVSALHGAAHARLDIPLSLAQKIYVLVVITVAPLVAALLLWKKQYAAGMVVFLCSMAGALCFGVYNHFIASSPDHVSHVAGMAAVGWVIVFQVTAALLALVEGAGCLVGVWMLMLYPGRANLTN